MHTRHLYIERNGQLARMEGGGERIPNKQKMPSPVPLLVHDCELDVGGWLV